jgi:hypothetical protein
LGVIMVPVVVLMTGDWMLAAAVAIAVLAASTIATVVALALPWLLHRWSDSRRSHRYSQAAPGYLFGPDPHEMISPPVDPRLQERPRQLHQLTHIGNPLRVPDDGHTPAGAQVWVQLVGLEGHYDVPLGGGQLRAAGNPDHHIVPPQPVVHRLHRRQSVLGEHETAHPYRR